MKTDQIIGCLLGTAVGDALGLPYEGLTKSRQKKIAPHINKYDFFLGKGMVSDDTEHTCMVAQSLIVSAGQYPQFTSQLAWRLKFWLLCLPAGVGFATLRAIVKLWLGFSPHHSGVFSAGNGPAMRSAIIGVCYGDDAEKMRTLVNISTRLTHSDRKAEYGALAIAIAAYLASLQTIISPEQYYETLITRLSDSGNTEEFRQLIKKACESASKQETADDYAVSLRQKSGITGYIYNTVPVVIQVWLRHQEDYPTAIQEIIRLGGDTDSTAAILGGIIGAAVGKSGIPSLWLENLWEYPRNVKWIEALGTKLTQVVAHGQKQSALPLPIITLLLRNFFFLLVVLMHGFRRLLPPY